MRRITLDSGARLLAIVLLALATVWVGSVVAAEAIWVATHIGQ